MKKLKLLSIAAFVLSIISFVTSYVSSVHSERAAVRPVLVFEYVGEQGWLIRNVGTGPALDITVQHKRDTGPWFAPVRVPPVAAGGTFRPGWLGQSNLRGLGAGYNDVEDRAYTSTTVDDLTVFHEGSALPSWPERKVAKYWKQPEMLR